MRIRTLARLTLITVGLLFAWHFTVVIFKLPNYILPLPGKVFTAIINHAPLLAHEGLYTLTETLLGLFCGALCGVSVALMLAYLPTLGLWLLPVIVISQALPTFAIAPLFVLWFGFGLVSKIAITVLMTFFPVTSAFYDGLRETPAAWLDLAHSMRASRLRILVYMRMPAALPSLASGLKMAAALAPLGAIVGEWVGSSHGLGYLVLNANARMQIDLMFGVIVIITAFSLTLYFATDRILRYVLPC